MDVFKISQMKGGWFVGDFEPSLCRTPAVEVAIKEYEAGASELSHYHAVATEFTAVVSGVVEMSGTRLVAGEVARINPGEHTDFRALTKATTVVVKMPSVANDKFLSA